MSAPTQFVELMNEGRIDENDGERNFYELALKCSGESRLIAGREFAMADTYIRLTGRTRCLLKRFVRSVFWPWHINSATSSWAE